MNIEKRNEKQMFQKREAWSNGRDSQKADIVIAKWLIKDSISVLFFVILQSFQIKRRCVFFFRTAFLLHKTVSHAKLQGSIYYFVILIRSDPAI